MAFTSYPAYTASVGEAICLTPLITSYCEIKISSDAGKFSSTVCKFGDSVQATIGNTGKATVSDTDNFMHGRSSEVHYTTSSRQSHRQCGDVCQGF